MLQVKNTFWISKTVFKKKSPAMFYIDCCCLVTKSCPTVCDPMDCSLPGSSIHGILQARILEWVATAFSRGSGDHSLLRGFSRPRGETWVSRVADRFFTIWATRETPELPCTPFSPLFLESPNRPQAFPCWWALLRLQRPLLIRLCGPTLPLAVSIPTPLQHISP